MGLYIGIVTVLIVLMVPVALSAAVFLWRLYAEDRAADERQPRPFIRLSFVLAVKGSIVAVGASWLGAITIWRITGHEVPSEAVAVSVTMVLALEIAALISPLYLRWLRLHRFRRDGASSPPPWSKDD
jgi:hypothetical protein